MTALASESWGVGGGLAGYCWQAQRPRAIVLLQHGYAEYAERFVVDHGALIPRLVNAGFSVFAFDLPGHGGSPGTRGVVDVDQAVQHHLNARGLLEAQGLPLFLIGHSLGGLVTAASVVTLQDGIAGVILSSPAFDRRNTATRAIAERVAKISPEWGIAAQQPPGGLSRDETAVQRFADDPHIYRGPLPAVMAASALRVANRVHKAAPTWTVPTIIVHGTADPFTPSGDSVAMFGRIAARDKILELVDGGRHELLNDVESERVMTTLLIWIDTHVARAPILPKENNHE